MAKSQVDFSEKISDEINCSICLDILVNPRTFVPCGHSFCRSCCFKDSVLSSGRRRQVLSVTKCPHCRQVIEGTVPSRQLESLIDTLVTVPNLLFQNDDDKQCYLKRRKTEKERCPPATCLQVPARTKKRQRQDDGASQRVRTTNNNSGSGGRYSVPSYPLPGYYPNIGISNNNDNRRYASFQPPLPPPNWDNFVHLQPQPPPQEQSQIQQSSSTFSFRASSTTSRTTTAPAAAAPSSFDPMLAPLPPPFEMTNNGPVPVFTFGSTVTTATTNPVTASNNTAQSRQQSQMARSTSRGVSASDPICID